MRFLPGLLLFLLWAAFARYYYVCEIKHHCNEEKTGDIRPATLSLKDGNIVVYENRDQFLFDKGSAQPQLNDDNKAFLDNVATYLEDNPDKNLTITGYHLLSEKDMEIQGSFQENYGLVRAETIRRLLEERDAEEGRISMEDKLINAEMLPEEPVSFSLYANNEGELTQYQKLSFTFNNMTFSDANFEHNSDVFDPGRQFRLYADSVATYLQLNPNKGLTIIGHTDNTGRNTYNDKLGMRRAKNAGLYFEELGVENKIKIESRGEDEPVAPNNTDENRQKNRRVNVVIE